MLVIREAQLRMLSEARFKAFAARMVEHLRRVFPEWAERHTFETLHAFVQQGMARARRYGFEVELDVARYLHVMRHLGESFDQSPEHPWAPVLLTSALPPSRKMDRLRDATEYQLEARRLARGR
jgi:hypothetical protein